MGVGAPVLKIGATESAFFALGLNSVAIIAKIRLALIEHPVGPVVLFPLRSFLADH